jgi:tricorn protease
LEVRGKLFSMANWEGAVRQHGQRDGVRYRCSGWLRDGERLVTVSDEGGEEAVEIHRVDGSEEVVRLDGMDIGRPYGLVVSPTNDQVALVNHRCEVLLVDLDGRSVKKVDATANGFIQGISWSPDGRWLAYGFPSTQHTCSIKVLEAETGESWLVTPPEFNDVDPAWDPEGKYLYFISWREFNPVYDDVHFDLGFPQAMRPMLITLTKDLANPFVPVPRPLQESDKDKKEAKGSADEKRGKAPSRKRKKPTDDDDAKEPNPIEIDFEGIEQRVTAFPYPEGHYWQIYGIDGKVLFTSYPVEKSLRRHRQGEAEEPKGTLQVYDFKEQKKDTLVTGVGRFSVELSMDGKTLAYMSRDRLRVIKAGEKPEQKPGPRANTFSDLMWEMQGELGTSHCYEFGGDYRPWPNYAVGSLGADFIYDRKPDGYRIMHVVKGDPWEDGKDSPLNAPGINVKEGDVLMSIGGRRLGRGLSPGKLLVNLSGQEVDVHVLDGESGDKRTVTLKAMPNDEEARYREWVRGNRAHVHEKTDGKVGYVHIPDMMGRGYAEFHRGYLAELDRAALIVDVRYNSGGHVSPLILEKIARRRVGYTIHRWRPPSPYPRDSILGPRVAITNEESGSDGDIFSHCFKLMGIGPLIGKRTWGGVIGISPHDQFVDGGGTTQPEHSFWFKDVGWGVENYGTDPDIEVDYTPQDYAAGRDPQLDRGIEEILRLMAEDPPELPDFGERPRLRLPKLPSQRRARAEAQRRRGKARTKGKTKKPR